MNQKNYSMEVLINGKPAKEYYHEGRHYIEGRKDSVFTIRLKNNTPERVLFVPSVDGLSVMDGEDASFDDRGYIVDGYSSMVIDGWRLSDDKVAEFYFSSPEQSYRKRANKGNNIGSIAVAVFKEKQNIMIIPQQDAFPKENKLPWMGTGGITFTTQSTADSATLSSSSANYSPSAFSMRAQDVGTGFGNEVESHVTSVYFEREARPVQIMELFYNSRKQLEGMGINFKTHRTGYVSTSSFPAQPGYCRPPNR